MKKIIVFIWVFAFTTGIKAQSTEIQQLLLNVEKLAQFKKILRNMKDGYQIIFKGYTAIKGISQGSFNIHKVFLDGLLEVSPAVKKYKRVADIISYQAKIIKEYKAAFNRFKADKIFSPDEISYIGKVYGNLTGQSLKNLNELLLVITANTLRMSDDERLQAIDKIYASVVDQFSFLKDFTASASMLSVQRKMEKAEIEMSRKIYGQ
jgi:hypothetical protein